MKMFSLFFGLLICGSAVYTQTVQPDNKIRVYNYLMNPRLHPGDNRRAIKPPDANTFNNQIQFMALRELDSDYVKKIEKYTQQYELGNILWPFYTLLYNQDLENIVKEIKNRNLYLFDLWGYVPGSGPGDDPWQQFKVPEKTLELFEQQLGDRWLGMDNGEQDGRYIGHFVNKLYPTGSGRERQYLKFQNHFQRLCDQLGNKMAVLVSLNYGHYFLKEGVYTLIGAETAQALPNTQIYYSFIRGAGKQYGVPWFGNASVFNRWGWKSYTGNDNVNQRRGEKKGTSLSLLKRLMYSQIFYNCVAVGFESSFFKENGQLSPIGKIQQSAYRWVKQYGTPGVMYTPVAVMIDFFAGWTFPRHLYNIPYYLNSREVGSGNIYRVWGNLPYQDGDFLTNDILNMFYPGYQDASYFHDETGFITPTPYGDVVDCILSDSPSWLLEQYSVLVIGGKLNGGSELNDKLETYVRQGGHLIITAGSLENLPRGLAGIKVGDKIKHFDKGQEIIYKRTKIKEDIDFTLKEIILPLKAKVISSCNNMPAIVQLRFNKGLINVLASPFGIGDSAQAQLPVKSGIDNHLDNPFQLLKHVRFFLDDVFKQTKIFNTNDSLSLITCRKRKNEYTIAISNNTWTEKLLDISSNAGKIKSITQLPLDCSEMKSVGYFPENSKYDIGKNTKKTIAGGDIRIFKITLEEKNVEEIPFIQPIQNPLGYGIVFRNILSIKEEILLRPTFFQHFDQVAVDWNYFNQKEKSILQEEVGWIKRQGLKIVVDFSSGINLFPDLRLVNNDTAEYKKSIGMIHDVIDKIAVIGVTEIILSSHRMIENNFTRDQFNESLIKTVKEICKYSTMYNINIHFRIMTGKFPYGLDQAIEFVRSIDEPNFYISPSAALILNNPKELGKNLSILKDVKSDILFVSAPGKDMQGKLCNINNPINKYTNKQILKQILLSHQGNVFILDGIYKDKNEEYLDIKTMENLFKN